MVGRDRDALARLHLLAAVRGRDRDQLGGRGLARLRAAGVAAAAAAGRAAGSAGAGRGQQPGHGADRDGGQPSARPAAAGWCGCRWRGTHGGPPRDGADGGAGRGPASSGSPGDTHGAGAWPSGARLPCKRMRAGRCGRPVPRRTRPRQPPRTSPNAEASATITTAVNGTKSPSRSNRVRAEAGGSRSVTRTTPRSRAALPGQQPAAGVEGRRVARQRRLHHRPARLRRAQRAERGVLRQRPAALERRVRRLVDDHLRPVVRVVARHVGKRRLEADQHADGQPPPAAQRRVQHVRAVARHHVLPPRPG